MPSITASVSCASNNSCGNTCYSAFWLAAPMNAGSKISGLIFEILNLAQQFRGRGDHTMTHSKIMRLEKTLLALWFLLNLGLGALTVHEYGMSVDEPNNQRYAVDTLDA